MSYKTKIYYHHTDSGGLVYYAQYLWLLEEARTSYLAECGVDIKAFMEQGRFFVVSRQELDYCLPLRYQDTVRIETVINGCSGVRIDLRHTVLNQRGETAAVARTVLAFIDNTFKPRPLPRELRAALEDRIAQKGPDA